VDKKVITIFVIMAIVIAIQGAYIYQLTKQVDDLSHAVSSLRLDSDISELDWRVRNLESQISSNESEISILNDSISDIDSRLDNLVLYLNAGFCR
jgi:hypothetical protein